MLFSLHEFEWFWVFFLSWFLVSSSCSLRTCLIWFQFSWICWGLFCVLSCGLSLKTFHVHFNRMFILLLWDERFYIYQLSTFDLIPLSVPQYPCWYFVWKIYLLVTGGVKIPYYNCAAVYIFLEASGAEKSGGRKMYLNNKKKKK